ncbi:MAG: hypothetical protein ACREHF_03365 [Rhizomicrobium sp.]
MYVRQLTAGVAAAFALSGCAGFLQKIREPVVVDSTPVQGADCTLTNDLGTWYLFTPGRVIVRKSGAALKVTCEKQGYRSAHMVVRSHFHASKVMNVYAGGESGIRSYAASDADYDYDSPIVVELTPATRPAPRPR